jgi:hypothetical protein
MRHITATPSYTKPKNWATGYVVTNSFDPNLPPLLSLTESDSMCKDLEANGTTVEWEYNAPTTVADIGFCIYRNGSLVEVVNNGTFRYFRGVEEPFPPLVSGFEAASSVIDDEFYTNAAQTGIWHTPSRLRWQRPLNLYVVWQQI